MALLALVFVSLCLPNALSGQELGVGIRVGAGIDGEGSVVGGQVELVDFGTSSSVELALAVFGARLVEDYRDIVDGGPFGPITHDYHESTRVRGAGLIASILIGQGPRDSRGPYLAVGLGLGPFDVDWHIESPTYTFLGSPRPAGGSIREQHRPILGGLGSLGLGLRIHRRLDVRAQALTLMAPTTDARRDLKLIATYTLTAGVGI